MDIPPSSNAGFGAPSRPKPKVERVLLYRPVEGFLLFVVELRTDPANRLLQRGRALRTCSAILPSSFSDIGSIAFPPASRELGLGCSPGRPKPSRMSSKKPLSPRLGCLRLDEPRTADHVWFAQYAPGSFFDLFGLLVVPPEPRIRGSSRLATQVEG